MKDQLNKNCIGSIMRFLLKYLGVISILFIANCSVSQDVQIKDIKKLYKEQSDTNCISLFRNSKSQIKQIILVRHGNPDLYKKGWRNKKEAIRYMHDYDSVGVKSFSEAPVCIETLLTDTIYHSSIPRAQNTAQLAFGNSFVLDGSYQYREFERKCMNFFNIKLPLKFWTAGSRILWLMGFNKKGIESFRQAKQRADQNAETLEFYSQNNDQTLLVAHGLHNKFVKKYLKKRGWKKVFSNGKGYLSVIILAKPEVKLKTEPGR